MWSNIVVWSVITQVRSKKLRSVWRLALNWVSFNLHLISKILISSSEAVAWSHDWGLLNNWLNILHVFFSFDIDDCRFSVNHCFLFKFLLNFQIGFKILTFIEITYKNRRLYWSIFIERFYHFDKVLVIKSINWVFSNF